MKLSERLSAEEYNSSSIMTYKNEGGDILAGMGDPVYFIGCSCLR